MGFPFLHLIYRLPIPYEYKIKCKKKLFYDKFAKFARDQFRISSGKGSTTDIEVYDLGPFKICIKSFSEFFLLNNLEWNLSYEYFDILYPAFNQNYFKLNVGEGPYETDGVFCEKGDYVIDAGANLGMFSFLSSVKVGDIGHVFAIEPISFFSECLKESIKINSTKNISILEVALGSDDKEVIMNLDYDNPGKSSNVTKSSKTVTVRQAKIDSLVFENKIPKVDFLKMDIEGSERNALLGGSETIFKFKPKLSICTYHLKDDPVVIKDLIKHINPDYKIKMGNRKCYAMI